MFSIYITRIKTSWSNAVYKAVCVIMLALVYINNFLLSGGSTDLFKAYNRKVRINM